MTPPPANATPATIVDNLARGRRSFADRPLLVTEAGATTYAEFAELVEGAAERLAAEGLQPGDRLAVCLRNGLDVAVAIWACARAGFVFVGLPTNLDRIAWAALVEHAQPGLLVAHEEFLPALPETARPVADLLTGQRAAWRSDRPSPSPTDTYAVVYTSGTTGRPKAAAVTHRATMHVASVYTRLLELTPDDVTAIHLPFSYVSGHISQLNPIMLAGGSAVTMPRFSAAELVRVIRTHAVTVIDVVPSILALLLREPDFDRSTRLRTAFFGGAPMPASTVDELRTRLPRLQLFNVYGMSETAGLIAALPDADFSTHPDSVGQAVADTDVRLTADGELLVRGPTVMPGYWRDPSATADAIEDGWLHTGDIARIDDSGYIYMLDRTKNMINRGGVKIYPADVEHALLAHPAVTDAVAVGIPDGLAGEAVACVVTTGESTLTANELKAWLRHRLPVHARPKQVRVLTELPRNPTGKADRPAVRALFESDLPVVAIGDHQAQRQPKPPTRMHPLP